MRKWSLWCLGAFAAVWAGNLVAAAASAQLAVDDRFQSSGGINREVPQKGEEGLGKWCSFFRVSEPSSGGLGD